MYSAATSRYQAPGQNEATNGQLSEEELAKLQELHELINLMFSEMPVRMNQSGFMNQSGLSQGAAPPFAPPMFPVMPYTLPFFQTLWGSAPGWTRPGF